MSYVSFIKYIACTERNKKHWTNINGNPWSIIFKNSHRARAGSTWIISVCNLRPPGIYLFLCVCLCAHAAAKSIKSQVTSRVSRLPASASDWRNCSKTLESDPKWKELRTQESLNYGAVSPNRAGKPGRITVLFVLRLHDRGWFRVPGSAVSSGWLGRLLVPLVPQWRWPVYKIEFTWRTL